MLLNFDRYINLKGKQMSIHEKSHSVGLFDALRGLLGTVVDIIHTRLDLLVTELAEEQANILRLCLITALSLLCAFLGLVFVALFIVIAFWDTPYRLWATGVIALILILVSAILWRIVIEESKKKGRLLAATLQALVTDKERLT